MNNQAAYADSAQKLTSISNRSAVDMMHGALMYTPNVGGSSGMAGLPNHGSSMSYPTASTDHLMYRPVPYGYSNSAYYPNYNYQKMNVQGYHYNNPPVNNNYYSLGNNQYGYGITSSSSSMRPPGIVQHQQAYPPANMYHMPGMHDMSYGYGMPPSVMPESSMAYHKNPYPYNDNHSSYYNTEQYGVSMPRLSATSYPQIPASLSELNVNSINNSGKLSVGGGNHDPAMGDFDRTVNESTDLLAKIIDKNPLKMSIPSISTIMDSVPPVPTEPTSIFTPSPSSQNNSSMVSDLMYLQKGKAINSPGPMLPFPVIVGTCPILIKGKVSYIPWSNEEETLLRSLIASEYYCHCSI